MKYWKKPKSVRSVPSKGNNNCRQTLLSLPCHFGCHGLWHVKLCHFLKRDHGDHSDERDLVTLCARMGVRVVCVCVYKRVCV